jgi:nitrous oxide reductase accessory protein NosL
MKKIIFILLIILSAVTAQEKEKFVKKAQTDNAVILQQGEAKDWCSICGMNLKMFYKTNHAVRLNDGSAKQYCSIRCLVADHKNVKDNIKHTLVVDAMSEKFTDAKEAFYVVGSNAPGTMTKVSKIAFKKEHDAKEFSKKFGGNSIMNFDQVFKLAKEQMTADNKMLMMKKEKKIYPKGAKLFSKLCNKTFTLPEVSNIAELKAVIKEQNICKNINEQQLQMIAIYLWEVELVNPNKDKFTEIKVPKIEKCPVCGMFVYKYPKWAASLDVELETASKTYYFDGVKDLMKFQMNPTDYLGKAKFTINKIWVTDYYKQHAIDGKTAIYVIESDVYGPMGNELIPFSNKADALNFIKDHGGKIIHSIADVTPELIESLDQ